MGEDIITWYNDAMSGHNLTYIYLDSNYNFLYPPSKKANL